jgi:hypothetical protein
MTAMLAYMDNNNQRFKDAATTFETLENNQTQLELTTNSKTVALRSIPGRNSQTEACPFPFLGLAERST